MHNGLDDYSRVFYFQPSPYGILCHIDEALKGGKMQKIHAIYISMFLVLMKSGSLHAWSWKNLIPQLKEQELVDQNYTLLPQSILKIEAQTGSIKLIPTKREKLLITATKVGIPEELPDTTIESTLEGREVVVKTVHKDPTSSVTVDYEISVPAQVTKIYVSSVQSPIIVQSINCPLELSCQTGTITIREAQKQVHARTDRGSITIEQTKLPASAHLFLEVVKGNVKLTLPKKVQASLNARTLRGTLTCLIPVTLEPRTTILTPQTRRLMAREAQGTFGSSKGAPITIDVTRGTIDIRPLPEKN